MASMTLAEHLLVQHAPKAAARLEASRGNSSVSKQQEGGILHVANSQIHVIEDSQTCVDFLHEMACLATDGGMLAVDVEWRPDVGHTNHPPSLLQLASVVENNGFSAECEPRVWLLDIEAFTSASASSPLAINLRDVSSALSAAFQASHVRILGFSFQSDLDKLSLLSSWNCFSAARCVIDLRDACVALQGRHCPAGSPKCIEFSLSAQLEIWTGFRLDKKMQCSDWARRPLTPAQIQYAAADAACLILLYRAMASHNAAELVERDMAPSALRGLRFEGMEAVDLAGGSESLHKVQEETLSVVKDAAASVSRYLTGSCQVVSSTNTCESDCVELNALCFTVAAVRHGSKQKRQQVAADGQLVLVLIPASAGVDLRWLSNWLGVARRRLSMATASECVQDFGALPGTVPPVPLRAGVRVLAFPSLCAASKLCASTGHASWRLLITSVEESLPLLCNAPNNLPNSVSASSDHRFEWLPDPSSCLRSLDDAIDRCARCDANAASKSGDIQGPMLSLIVDCSLATLARKLRMVGIDCEVAGETVRTDAPGLRGLMRVKIEMRMQEFAMRRAVALGRLIVTAAGRSAESLPGVHYRLLATDADAQFAELLEVFKLEGAVHWGMSRCGICNSQAWRTLEISEVHGFVPDGVLASETEFYQCGLCGQIFWPGEKYVNTMDSLKAAVLGS